MPDEVPSTAGSRASTILRATPFSSGRQPVRTRRTLVRRPLIAGLVR
jgi:hypothetical protein